MKCTMQIFQIRFEKTYLQDRQDPVGREDQQDRTIKSLLLCPFSLVCVEGKLLEACYPCNDQVCEIAHLCKKKPSALTKCELS